MRRTVILLTLALACGGPALAGEKGVDLRHWIGKHRDEIVAAWGDPTEVKQKGSGEVLLYRTEVAEEILWGGSDVVAERESLRLPPTTIPPSTMTNITPPAASSPSHIKQKTIKVRFYVDEDGIVMRCKPNQLDLWRYDKSRRRKAAAGEGDEAAGGAPD